MAMTFRARFDGLWALLREGTRTAPTPGRARMVAVDPRRSSAGSRRYGATLTFSPDDVVTDTTTAPFEILVGPSGQRIAFLPIDDCVVAFRDPTVPIGDDLVERNGGADGVDRLFSLAAGLDAQNRLDAVPKGELFGAAPPAPALATCELRFGTLRTLFPTQTTFTLGGTAPLPNALDLQYDTSSQIIEITGTPFGGGAGWTLTLAPRSGTSTVEIALSCDLAGVGPGSSTDEFRANYDLFDIGTGAGTFDRATLPVPTGAVAGVDKLAGPPTRWP